MKIVYFDVGIFKTNWKAINEGPLKKAGLLVRKIARNSIRKGRKAYARTYRGLEKVQERIKQTGTRNIPSPPGSPPRWHTIYRTGKKPFKDIVSLPREMAGTTISVLVGMVRYPRKGDSGEPIPGIHEHGGTAVRRVVVDQSLRPRRYRKKVRRRVRYPARPFMRPAERQARLKYPRFWRNALKNIKKR